MYEKKGISKRTSNGKLIKSILVQKKELEILAREIMKKSRIRKIHLTKTFNQKRVFLSTSPESLFIGNLHYSKELKIPTHDLSLECGLSVPIFSHVETPPISISIRKITKKVKTLNKRQQVLTIPNPQIKKFSIRSNTPVIKRRKNSLNKSLMSTKNAKLSEWSFTPL